MNPDRQTSPAPVRNCLRAWSYWLALILATALGAGRLAAADDPVLVARLVEQITLLQAEKRARTPAQQKLDSALIYAERTRRLGRASAAVATLKTTVEADARGMVLVDITATVSIDLLDAIKLAGGEVQGSYPIDNAIRALLPLAAIEGIAGHKDVRFIQPAIGFTTNVTSEGDVAHRANTARSTFGLDGTGVKVGVLSDSADHLTESQAAGELGTVTVLPNRFGSGLGEGTAMLEIVHDLAPGAALFFSTANGGPGAFAQSIRDLKAAGCQVIVDDVSYFNESPFQDGPVARAVNEVSNGDVLYFSSAGNSGNKNDTTSGTWEGDFLDSGVTLSDGSRLHNFGGGVTQNIVTLASSGRVDLFWADPLGASANDYDVYVANSSGTLVRASTNAQVGAQDPYESISTLSTNERVVIALYSGASRFLHVDTGRSRLTVSTSGQTRGHNAAGALNAFCVAATSANGRSTPFTGGPSNPVETFSSDGFRRIFFTPEGTAITAGNFSSTGGLLLQKPDVTAADGVATSLASPFNPFFGTSAAAPHAAAIAALLRAARPTITGAQLRNALAASALDIEGGGFDRDSGPGIIMAQPMIAALPATPNLTPFTPAGWSGRIVVSTVTGGNTDAPPQFTTANTLFVDFAVANNGGSSVTSAFTTELYVDGALKTTTTTNPTLAPNGISTTTDFNIGTLTAGLHTIRVKTDAGGAVAEADETDNEFTRTITVINAASAPNLTPTTPAGWSDRIVISNVTGTNSDSSPLLTTNTIYLDLAVLNAGTVATGTPFDIELVLDGVALGALTSPAINAGGTVTGTDINIGSLAAGQHTIGIRIDAGQTVAESIETDNSYTRTFFVNGTSSAPTVTLPDPVITFTENNPATILDASGTVADSDSADFNGGSLTVDFVGTSLPEDRLAIRNQGTGAGQIGVSGATVTFGGATIGTFTGGTDGATPLVVTFTTATATPAAAQALVRNITYQNVSDNPSTTGRSVRFVVNDGDLSSSSPVSKAVTVTAMNDAPTITGQQTLSTPEETALTVAFANLTVSDPDNTYPTGFTLSVQNGTNYTRSGNTITPAADFNGILTVPVTVSDGAATSNVFNLSVTVTPVNDAPTITGQQPLSTPEETALTVAFANLTVSDPDNTYPTGFALSVQNGSNYTRSGNTITPAADFNGTLTVPVTVSDGTASSNLFNLSVTVTPINDAPSITGQQPLSTPEETALTIAFANLTVTDPDNTYPTGFTLSVQNGTNYTRSGNTITPAADFNGILTVPVTVSDGAATSNVFNLSVTVTPVNDAPTITGQQPLSTPEETALTVAFANLTVSDPDNTYPTGFTLSVQNGSNYTRSGNTITPAADFNGTLTVPVTVSDGTASSNLFNLSVTVTPVNDAPSITGQQPLSTPEETALTIAFANLTVTDPDNTYPTGFTLSVQNGSNYTRSGNTITPAADFNGILTLPVTVSDGVASSNAFNLSVTVTPINDAPTITGQQPLSTPEETALTIAFANLTVTDPDNSYPTGFTLSVQNGTNYTRSGNTITPAGDFNGILTVPVTVSDGAASSNVFNLSVTVTPVNDAPTITGQQPLSTPEETALTIAFANLTVTDPDNTYPTGFSLSVQNGTNYTRLGNTITPAADFNGILTVPVTVSDGTASSNVFNLSVTVTPVNDAPTITGQQPLSTPEGAALTVAFANLTVTDPDNTYPTGFTLSVQNGTNYTRSGNTITPATDFNGALTVPVTVNDGTATSNVFNLAVTVTAVNNAPSFVVGPNQSVPQGATAQAVAHFATGISPGPADESGQNLDFIVTFDHAELFAAGAGPTISPTTGDLIYTPAPDASGTSTVKVMLHDNGGTSNGGIDTSAPQTFTISVTTPAEELGTYHGVALPATGATPGADKTGLLVLTLGKKNVVTGKLRLGTFSYSFKGFIDNAGLVHFGNTPGTPKLMLDRDNLSSLELTIRVDVGGGSDQLTGVITDTSGGGAFANITADRALFTAKKKFLPPFKLVPEELLVPYTAIFDEPVAPSGVLVPHGDGFGILTVSKKGVAKLAGKLADGSKFTYANALSKDQFWPLWVPFLKGQGALAGIVRFHPVADTSDFDGQGLLWFSPGTGSFPAGWAGGTTTDLLGSTYIVTKAKPTALPNPFAPGGDGNAELTLTGGHLATPKVRKALSIETGNKVATVPLDDADQLKASIIAGKGLFKGSFVHPDTGDKTTFEGAIFQKQAFGSGFFLGTDAAGDTQAGAVTIVPDDHPLVP